MDIRLTQTSDWVLLKQVRLAALQDAPTAFGVSYQTAASYTDEQWQERADSGTGTQFWLAIKDGKALQPDRHVDRARFARRWRGRRAGGRSQGPGFARRA